MIDKQQQINSAGEFLSGLCSQARSVFRPDQDFKVTLLIYLPGSPEADVLISNGDFDEMIAAIERARGKVPRDMAALKSE